MQKNNMESVSRNEFMCTKTPLDSKGSHTFMKLVLIWYHPPETCLMTFLFQNNLYLMTTHVKSYISTILCLLWVDLETDDHWIVLQGYFYIVYMWG